MSDFDSNPSPADPADELPPLPEPFATEPEAIQVKGGCGRMALFGCGGLILLFGVAMLLLTLKANQMLVWVFGKLETQIELGLPDDLPEEDRARLQQAFDDLYVAIEAGEIQPAALQRLQGKVLEISADIDRGLSAEQVRDLARVLELAAGTAVEEGSEAPEPEAEPPPEREPGLSAGLGAVPV